MPLWAINNTWPERVPKLSEAHASHFLKPLTKRKQNFRAKTNVADQGAARVLKEGNSPRDVAQVGIDLGTQVSCLLTGQLW